MVPFSPDGTFVLFQLRKILCFKSRAWEAKKTGKFMRTLNGENERDEAKEEAQIAQLAIVAVGGTRVRVEDNLARV